MHSEFDMIRRYQDLLKSNFLNEECVDSPDSFVEEAHSRVDVKMEEPDEHPDFYDSFTCIFDNDAPLPQPPPPHGYSSGLPIHINTSSSSSSSSSHTHVHNNTNTDSIDSKAFMPIRTPREYEYPANSTSTPTTTPINIINNNNNNGSNSLISPQSIINCRMTPTDSSTHAQASFFAAHLSQFTPATSYSPSPVPSSSLSSLSSSSSSPSALSTSASSASPYKTSSYVKEMAGSGCVLVSRSPALTFEPENFLDQSVPQGSPLEYTNLDDAYLNERPMTVADTAEGMPFEEAMREMKMSVQTDCAKLDLPFEPSMWSPAHVSSWIRWVCQKEAKPDISGHFGNIDGVSLFSDSATEFLAGIGPSGQAVANELEFFKAAFSYSPELSYETMGMKPNPVNQFIPSTQYSNSSNNSYITPCSSPESTTSRDSECSYGMFNSEPLEENGFYCPKPPQSVSPCPTGYNRPEQKPVVKVPGQTRKQTIHLWQFLRELLISKESQADCIRWIDRNTGIFKIEDSKKVATMWGQRKNRPAMNYDKLSRSVRQYYKKGIIKKTTQSKRLVYQFCPAYL